MDVPGSIDTQMMKMIIESPLVIADLTGGNPNVYYELGIRHSIGKPYIQIISEGEQIPFDINGIRTIEVNHKDLDSAATARKAIEKQIKTIENGHIPDSPVSIALGALELQKDNRLAESIQERLSNIEIEIQNIPGETELDHKLADVIDTIIDSSDALTEEGFTYGLEELKGDIRILHDEMREYMDSNSS